MKNASAMFFPKEFNVTKKGLNIPWHLVFQSSTPWQIPCIPGIPGVKKTILKAKNNRQSIQKNKLQIGAISDETSHSIQNHSHQMQPLEAHSSEPQLSKESFPVSFFPNSIESTVSNHCTNSESNVLEFDNFFEHFVSEQNDLLQQAVNSIDLAQPSQTLASQLAQPASTLASHLAFNPENSANDLAPFQPASTLTSHLAFNPENSANDLAPFQPASTLASHLAFNPENSANDLAPFQPASTLASHLAFNPENSSNESAPAQPPCSFASHLALNPENSSNESAPAQPPCSFASHSALNPENSSNESSPAQPACSFASRSAFNPENSSNESSPAQPACSFASRSAFNPENSSTCSPNCQIRRANTSKTINDLLTSLFHAQNQLNHELERIKCFLEQLK
jgi:hypothetical protein